MAPFLLVFIIEPFYLYSVLPPFYLYLVLHYLVRAGGLAKGHAFFLLFRFGS